MSGKYDHQFDELGEPAAPADLVVDVGSPAGGATDQTGAVKINEAPGNPDKGKNDQFDSLPSDTPAGDDVIDAAITVEGDEEDRASRHDSVKERIDRERQLRQESEERLRRIEAEYAAVKARLDITERSKEWEKADREAAEKLADLKAKKVKAKEEGDTAADVDLDEQILDLKAGQQVRLRERKEAEDAAKRAKDEPGASAPVANPKAQAWLDKHPAYKTDPLFQAAAKAADRLLYSEGSNPNSDDYYRELSRLLSRKFADKLDDEYLKGPRGGKPPVRGAGSDGVRGGDGGVSRTGSKTKVTITRDELAMLSAMHLDVTDPQVLREFARNKMAAARGETRE